MLDTLKFAQYIANKQRVLPIYLIFGITNVCDSRCLTCFAWQQLDEAKKEELSFDEIEKILSSWNHQLLTLVLTGGEIFLRKDLVEIIKLFHIYLKPNFIALPTNGIKYDNIHKTIINILDAYPGNLAVNLSLDGLGDVHDEIRGVPGNFAKIGKLYKLLEQLKKKYNRLSLGVNTVLNNRNSATYKEIFEYVKKNFPAIDQHNFEVMRGDFRSKDITPPDLDFLRKETGNIQKLSGSYNYHKSGIYQKFLHAAKIHYHNVVLDHLDKKRALPCYAGSLAAVVDYKGITYPCELYRKIGSLRDFKYDFPALWFSPQGDEIRKEIRKTKCTCSHSCFQFVNILFNPFEYPRLLNPYRKA